ncbi:hypothetical protein AT01_1079 [Yersinia aldovae 670-83]|nr:hypothetical protein AT01_1079 [Yersinia aldovae 670-83]
MKAARKGQRGQGGEIVRLQAHNGPERRQWGD